MELFDISLNLSAQTVRWVTSPPFELNGRRRMSRGDPGNSSAVNMSVHAGTHVDAPFHYLANGKTIEQLPLDLFIGPATVVEIEEEGDITAAQIEALDLAGAERVLFKTRNSALLGTGAYDPSFVALSPAAAEQLAARALLLVGLDYLSVAHADEQVEVHRPLLERGIVILEGLDLSRVDPGRYELMCFPLRLDGSDGAPCRAVLRRP